MKQKDQAVAVAVATFAISTGPIVNTATGAANGITNSSGLTGIPAKTEQPRCSRLDQPGDHH